jgi:hypothetical protein
MDPTVATKEEQAAWLRTRGWSPYYNPNYWVHPKTVVDPTQQDYTDYGMSEDDAVAYEHIGRPPHKMMGIPGLSRMEMAAATKGLTQARKAE